jgi:hypothetical protein
VKRENCLDNVTLQNYFPFPGLILFLLFIQITVVAQEINNELVSNYNTLFTRAIGLDENLINGYRYVNQYSKINGHAFFGNNEFMSGSLVLNNKTYLNVSLKYDILNQNIILSYKNSNRGINHIVLQKKLITEFELDDKHFEKLYFPKTDTQFFQVLGNKNIKCLYLWRKTLEINPQSVQNYYEYSDQSKKTFLLINNKLKPYSGKHSFIKSFPEHLHEPIQRYMSKQKMKIKNASEESVIELIEFCESLIAEEIYL